MGGWFAAAERFVAALPPRPLPGPPVAPGAIYYVDSRARTDAACTFEQMSVQACDAQASVRPDLRVDSRTSNQMWRFELVPGLSLYTISSHNRSTCGRVLTYSATCSTLDVRVAAATSQSAQVTQWWRIYPTVAGLDVRKGDFVLEAVGRSSCAQYYLSAPAACAANALEVSALGSFSQTFTITKVPGELPPQASCVCNMCGLVGPTRPATRNEALSEQEKNTSRPQPHDSHWPLRDSDGDSDCQVRSAAR